MDNITIGLVEPVTLVATETQVDARIDTGATIGSIDESLIANHDVEYVGHKIVKSSHGTTKRKLIELEIILAGKSVKGKFSVFDRSHMTYPVLIGQDVLKQGFLIDPNK